MLSLVRRLQQNQLDVKAVQRIVKGLKENKVLTSLEYVTGTPAQRVSS